MAEQGGLLIGGKVVSKEKLYLIYIRHLIQKCHWNEEEYGYCPICKAEEYKRLDIESKKFGGYFND